MPSVYLSPSTQEFNPYIGGGNEEYYMNLIADAMEPYLTASGISFTRNSPQKNVNSSVAQSNAGNYDFHLALHSNATAEGGGRRGIEIYYYPYSYRGKRAAEIFAKNLKAIYPLPNSVKLIPTTALAEVRRTRAPAILVEYGYHDDPQDADWIRNNIDLIAKNSVLSLCEYFGIPFRAP